MRVMLLQRMMIDERSEDDGGPGSALNRPKMSFCSSDDTNDDDYRVSSVRRCLIGQLHKSRHSPCLMEAGSDLHSLFMARQKFAPVPGDMNDKPGT